MFFSNAQQSLVRQGLRIIEASWSKSDTSHSVWFLRTIDRLYLTAHNSFYTDIHPLSPGGFEPTISVSERPQTHALDRSATGINPTVEGVAKAPVSPQWNISKTDSLQLP